MTNPFFLDVIVCCITLRPFLVIKQPTDDKPHTFICMKYCTSLRERQQ